MSDAVVITNGPVIPAGELTYRATRSGGPGGQHVNTSSTRIELTWNVAESPSLNDEQRARIMTRLKTRIDESGTLRIVASDNRSQTQNRDAATERFAKLIADALRERKARKRTKPPRASKENRLQEKKQRSETKKRRAAVKPEE